MRHLPYLLVSACFSLLVGVGCDDDSPAADSGDGAENPTPPGSDGGMMPPGPGAQVETDLPCEVADVLAEHCWACHSDPPQNAAPMPLVTVADFSAPAVSDAAATVFSRVADRINNDDNPMPPAPRARLNDAQIATLETWFGAGTPGGEADETCDVTMPVPAPTELPCEPTHEFLAHVQDSEEPFPVPEDAGNLYQCFTFKSPFTKDNQATAWAPIIDDPRVLHHWIVWRTQEPQVDGAVGPCDMPSDSQFLMGWAPGGGVFVMPDDVGLELRQDADTEEYLILQIHYWNVAGHTDAFDRSGVSLCATDAPRPQAAGVLTVGSFDLDIPARSRDVTFTGGCGRGLTTAFISEPLNIIGSGPHMHEFGTKFHTEILRGGTDPETLIKIDNWDFNAQQFYRMEPAVRLMPGDAIRTSCTYDNPTDERVTFGERTEDEMCFDFTMVYPIEAIAPSIPRFCVIPMENP